MLIEGAGGVMSPIDDSHTVLDLIAGLGHPAVLVTGSYLGAISHTLTAICALKSRGVPIQGVLVSESPRCAGLLEVLVSLRRWRAPIFRSILSPGSPRGASPSGAGPARYSTQACSSERPEGSRKGRISELRDRLKPGLQR